MKKHIDKILYFFGYAPIELKTIYKNVIISKHIEFDKLQIERTLDYTNNKDYSLEICESELLEEVKKRIEYFYIEKESRIVLRLYVNKINLKKD